MLKTKKRKAVEKPIVYYNLYEYTMKIQEFSESDRLSKTDLCKLECYNQYQVERNLNSLSDNILNDYLYNIFYSKKPETATLMRHWISYFVRQHKTQLDAKVSKYLESKKLTLDEWLRGVSEGCRGDILSVYVLSIATGIQTLVHLKDNKYWCTLQDVPSTHDAILAKCERHLMYLGFGIFLRLENRTTPRAIGTITSDDPAMQKKLLIQVQQSMQLTPSFTGMTNLHVRMKIPSAAAGSAAQLAEMEQSIKTESTVLLA